MATDFQRAAGRWQKFEELCGYLDASLADVSRGVFANERLSTDERLKRLEVMKSSALDIARIGAEAKGRMAACKEMSRRVAMEVQQGQPMEEFVGTFKAGVESAQQQAQRGSLTQAAEVARVQKLIERLSGACDEDLEIQENVGAGSSRNLRCPVLNRPIEQPVKSTVCGHVYSLMGIISALYQAQRIMDEGRFPKSLNQVPMEYETRCPQVGCSHYISAGKLKRDFDTELTQRQLQSARDSMEEVDTVEVV